MVNLVALCKYFIQTLMTVPNFKAMRRLTSNTAVKIENISIPCLNNCNMFE